MICYLLDTKGFSANIQYIYQKQEIKRTFLLLQQLFKILKTEKH